MSITFKGFYMKKILFLVLAFRCAQAMDIAVHSIDDGKKIGDYWEQFKGVDFKKITMPEAHKLCAFILKQMLHGSAVFTLTPQQLAEHYLGEVYFVLHGTKIAPKLVSSSLDKELLVEESGRTVEAIFNYLITIKNAR